MPRKKKQPRKKSGIKNPGMSPKVNSNIEKMVMAAHTGEINGKHIRPPVFNDDTHKLITAAYEAEMAENPVELTPIEEFDSEMIAMTLAKMSLISDAVEYAKATADLDPSERNDDVDFPRFVEMKDREYFRALKSRD